MHNRRWQVGVVTGLFLTTWALVAFSNDPGTASKWTRSNQERTQSEQTNPESGELAGLVGTSGCSARACHGSLEPRTSQRVLQNEYIVWMQWDKHAHAYDVLLNDRSRIIAKNLANPGGSVIAAHQDERCLACHSIPAADYGELDRLNRLRDGVSCESCHGAAKNWVAEHTTEAWRGLPAEEKLGHGMKNTKDLSARAQMCVGCHVGAPANEDQAEPVRDAFHDIMAAGHPRLNFEFGNFLARMPKHWAEKDTRPDFELRVWAIGQVATAHAALKLLESRAHAAQAGKAPWPEFAEYECFACHHDLQEPSWRQHRRYPGRKPGALPWGTWFLPMTRVLAENEGRQELVAALDSIENFMSTPSDDRAYPNMGETANRAGLAAKSLSEILQKLAEERFDNTNASRQLASACVKDSETLVKSNWDAAAQLYLALVAINQALKNDQLKAALDVMFKELEFPRDYESPKRFRKDFRPGSNDAFEEELKIIQQKVGQ